MLLQMKWGFPVDMLIILLSLVAGLALLVVLLGKQLKKDRKQPLPIVVLSLLLAADLLSLVIFFLQLIMTIQGQFKLIGWLA